MSELILSPSTINLFIKDPALFILKHFYGMVSGTNIWTIRGQVVEEGVNQIYKGKFIDEAIDLALDKYYQESFHLDDNILDIEYILPRWIRKAKDSLLSLGYKSSPKLQQEVKCEIEGMTVRGFTDYIFDDNHVVDLKTVNTLPKIISRGKRKGLIETKKIDNVRQQCFYKKALGNHEVSLLYVTDEDALVYNISDEEYGNFLKEIENAVVEIKKILTMGKEEATIAYRPNEKLFNTFYYTDDMKKFVKKLWKLEE